LVDCKMLLVYLPFTLSRSMKSSHPNCQSSKSPELSIKSVQTLRCELKCAMPVWSWCITMYTGLRKNISGSKSTSNWVFSKDHLLISKRSKSSTLSLPNTTYTNCCLFIPDMQTLSWKKTPHSSHTRRSSAIFHTQTSPFLPLKMSETRSLMLTLQV
jgi:hypothetical protein